ncbi:nicotinamide-nucleotide amidohydrolase family protein [Pseudomonas sp. 273]|uniref:CinA family protein n=1 Tax=Pseudomonas sp. 273 TaxID=75692 RepID=UPI0023D7F47A|nr:nicotinamide-nucleotide amidohydrolase family protein [Pseudomonas sp. 273]
MPAALNEAEGRALVTYLREAGLKLVTAESCSAGQICAELAAAADSAQVLEGGWMVYSVAAKRHMLGVPEQCLANYNLTSEEVARGMAEAALRHPNANVSVAVTGLLGCEPKDGIEPGTLCFAWAFRLRDGLTLFSRCEHLRGDPQQMRMQAIRTALLALPDYHRRACHGERA